MPTRPPARSVPSEGVPGDEPEPELPAGWVRKDTRAGKAYYFCVATGETQFERPRENSGSPTSLPTEEEVEPPESGTVVVVARHELLPVADKAVASIPDDEFNSKYKNAPDHAEGKATMQVCDATRSKIQGMPRILSEAELISDAHQPPDHRH